MRKHTAILLLAALLIALALPAHAADDPAAAARRQEAQMLVRLQTALAITAIVPGVLTALSPNINHIAFTISYTHAMMAQLTLPAPPSAAASIGIIGGADGPTAIYITEKHR